MAVGMYVLESTSPTATISPFTRKRNPWPGSVAVSYPG